MNKISTIDKLKFWNRCRIHRKEPEFVEHILLGYQNPDFLHLNSYGTDYKGETIYKIDEQGNGVGFFAELGVTLIKLYFADERGFTPYVQWGENYLYYEVNGVNGEKNAFRYFFMPVSHVENIDNACHVVHSEMRHYEQVKALFDAVSYEVSEEYVDAMASMLKKYIRYNPTTKDYLESKRKMLLGEKKTLGVHYRGTDFKKAYNNHPIVVKIEQTIAEVKKLLETGNYEQLFLATDEQEAIDKFVDVFGDKVKFFSESFRSNVGDESIAFSKSERKLHRYSLGLEILLDEYVLTMCEGLVCGYSNVTFIARVMRRGWLEKDYQDYVLINNGINHNSNNFWESGHAPQNVKSN